jgi:hypothetical protein
MTTEKERMQILEMVEKGQISAEEGVRLLNVLGPEGEETAGTLEAPETASPPAASVMTDAESALTGVAVPSAAGGDADFEDGAVEEGEVLIDDAPPTSLPPDAQKWKSWWTIPLWIGVAIAISGGFLMYTALERSGIGLSFICAGVPFVIGLGLLVLGWQSRVAPWLHLRVQQRPGEWPQRIAFSFPVPIRPTVWLVRTFGRDTKHINDVPLDEMLLAVGETTREGNPIYIQVDEGDQGEKVEIYIG